MIISMAWTSAAFIAGRKNVTRRQWKDEYAKRFKVGYVHDVWDKSPRFGGKFIGKLRIISIKKESISKMPDENYENEGFAYMSEKGLTIWGKEPHQAFEDWRNEGGMYWKILFEKL